MCKINHHSFPDVGATAIRTIMMRCAVLFFERREQADDDEMMVTFFFFVSRNRAAGVYDAMLALE